VARSARTPIAFRLTGLVVMGALALAGCSGSADGSTDSGSGTAAAADDAPAVPLPPGPIASVETAVSAAAGYEAQLVSAGVDEATAYVMGQTNSTVDVIDGHTFEVAHAFPNGATSRVAYHLFQAPDGSAGEPPVFEGGVVGDEYRFTLRYAIDAGTLPDDMRAQISAGLPTAAPARAQFGIGTIQPLGLAPIRPRAAVQAADGPSTLGVLADGVISQTQESYVDTWADRAEGAGFTKTAKSWEAFKAGRKVWDAVEAGEAISSGLERLKAIRKCAENPTEPIVQQAYKDHPEERQKILDALSEIDSDVQSSGMVMFTGMLTDTGSSLVSGAKWLGFIVSPATNYIKETNAGLIASRLAAAEQLVVPCKKPSYLISGSVPSVPSGIEITGKACSLGKPFKARTTGDFVGVLQFLPIDSSSGTWKFKGVVGNAPLNVKGDGSYTVTLDEAGETGTLDFAFVATIKIPMVDDPTGGGPASLDLTQGPPCT
jgi:hypothetical protein